MLACGVKGGTDWGHKSIDIVPLWLLPFTGVVAGPQRSGKFATISTKPPIKPVTTRMPSRLPNLSTHTGNEVHAAVIHGRVVAGRGGGPEKTILNSPRFLRPLGYDSVCLYMRSPQDHGFDVLRDRAAAADAPLIEVDDGGLRDWSILRRCAEAIERWRQLDRQDRPLIYHGHDYKSNLVGFYLRRRLPGLRLVTTVHGWVHRTWKTPLYYFIDRQCLPRYDHVVCVSPDLREQSVAVGVPSNRVSLIDNAIALDDYPSGATQEAERREAATELGLDPNLRWIAAVGRLSDEKGFDVLIRAVESLIGRGMPIGLAIAGEGAARSTLQQQIDRMDRNVKKGDRIRLLGFVADPRTLYRSATAYALSSYREGLPNVVLEAMAMRLPVVATRIAGMPRIIDDGINGRLVPAGDAGELADALEAVLGDPALSDRYAVAGRATVEQRFSFFGRMEQMARIYASVLAR